MAPDPSLLCLTCERDFASTASLTVHLRSCKDNKRRFEEASPGIKAAFYARKKLQQEARTSNRAVEAASVAAGTGTEVETEVSMVTLPQFNSMKLISSY